MSSVVRPLTNVAFSSLFAAVLAASAMPAVAAKGQPLTPQPVVERSASGTIIQPTTTIIPDGYGHSKVIVIPRRRSYLDTGTEVSIGESQLPGLCLAARRRSRPAVLVLWTGRSGYRSASPAQRFRRHRP